MSTWLRHGKFKLIFTFVQVSLGSAQEGGLTVATIHYSYRSRDSVASVFLHECDDDTGIGVPTSEIVIKGDFSTYCYTFFYDDIKIAQV